MLVIWWLIASELTLDLSLCWDSCPRVQLRGWSATGRPSSSLPFTIQFLTTVSMNLATLSSSSLLRSIRSLFSKNKKKYNKINCMEWMFFCNSYLRFSYSPVSHCRGLIWVCVHAVWLRWLKWGRSKVFPHYSDFCLSVNSLEFGILISYMFEVSEN